jgi:UDP-glucose 4-epimerase
VAGASPIPSPRGSGVAFVTGGFGFLGRALAVSLKAAGWTLGVIGNPPSTPARGLPPLAGGRTKGGRAADLFVAGEVSEAVLADFSESVGAPELVFHAAGGSSVGSSILDPEGDRERTLGSLHRTLEFMRARAPQARLIYPSSAAVYGAGHDGPIPEDAPIEPISPYGEHKAEAEAMIARAAEESGVKAVILRLFSVYGPGLRKQLLWELASRFAKAPASVELGGRGDERRDFLYIDDALSLVGVAATAEIGGAPLILNGGSGLGASVREIAEGFAAAMGARSGIRFSGAVRQGDPQSLVADISRAMALGFEPVTPLEAGLGQVAAWIAGLS